MSTRSSIALLNPDNTITAIYCHSDGYPTGVGAMLKANYASIAGAKAILAEGDCSILDKTIAESRFYNTWRGENTFARSFNSQEDWLKWLGRSDCEYAYLFSNNEWKVAYE